MGFNSAFKGLRRNERDVTTNVYWPSCEISMIHVKFEFSKHSSEKYSNMKFYETRPVRAELFHAGGLMDMKTLIVALRNFA